MDGLPLVRARPAGHTARRGNLTRARRLMYRLTAAVVMLLTGLALAAPRLKDPPKKTSPLVGQWRLVLMNGSEPGYSMDMEYLADGTAIRLRDKTHSDEYRSRYTTDTSTNPAQLDYLYNEAGKPPALCIFKVEGDTLTICYSTGEDRSRPKEFGQPRTMLQVLKRIKLKD
jgi:uncharacterized protein (TIGR03067 family)